MRYVSGIILLLAIFSCKKEKITTPTVNALSNGALVLCEGLFQQNNATLSWIDFSKEEVTNDFFTQQNGRQLGDTGNDLEVYGNKIYVIVTTSSTIEVIDKSNGKSIKQLDMKANGVGKQPRSITFYQGKAFVSCFDGYVDVIDTVSLEIEQRIKVGLNPDALLVNGNHLLVSNSGGLNSPQMDSTLSIIDLNSMTELQKVVVGKNPGKIALSKEGNIYVITRGNYGSIPSRMKKLNPISYAIEQTFDLDVSSIENFDNQFIVSYFNYNNNQVSISLFDTQLDSIVKENFIASSNFTTYYGLTYNEKQGLIYCFDAMSYVNTGYIKVFNKQGQYLKNYHLALNPSKIIFIE
jgi:DNA-binding beta-propeller fold protein YncE